MSWQNHLGFTSKLCEVFKNHASQYDMINMLTAINNNQKLIKAPSSSVAFISLLYPWPASNLTQTVLIHIQSINCTYLRYS